MHFFPNIFSVHPTLFAAADGRLYGTLKGERDFGTQYDVGTWQVTSDGHLCWRWHVRDSGRERCYTVYQEGETFELYVKDRLGKEVYRREPGNPEGY